MRIYWQSTLERLQMTDKSVLHHQYVDVENSSIHVVSGGDSRNPAVLFLHGWPENWTAFEEVMLSLSNNMQVVAIDLPGIGSSQTPPSSNDKRTLAKYVRETIQQLGLQDVTLVGHDVGGQIVYAYLHAYPDDLQRAVIMNVAIPGIEPWSEVVRNPYIWHFAFHSIPDLPETLVAGHEAEYFDFFYDQISYESGAIDADARETYVEAYSRPEALHTGFEWYRAFPQDEKDNLETKDEAVDTPVLYLREQSEGLDVERYVDGLNEGGLRNLQAQVIPNSGHFTLDEQPEAVLENLQKFIGIT